MANDNWEKPGEEIVSMVNIEDLYMLLGKKDVELLNHEKLIQILKAGISQNIPAPPPPPPDEALKKELQKRNEELKKEVAALNQANMELTRKESKNDKALMAENKVLHASNAKLGETNIALDQRVTELTKENSRLTDEVNFLKIQNSELNMAVEKELRSPKKKSKK